MAEFIAPLAWDTEFFGVRIGRVTPARLDSIELQRELARSEYDCLYWLCEANDIASQRVAEANGFQQMDIRVSMERPVKEAITIPNEYSIRPMTPADLDYFRSTIRTAHTDTRFFMDEHFAKERCADMYEQWLRNELVKWPGLCVTLEIDGTPAGYNTLHVNKDSTSLGLLGVHEQFRGRGVASALIAWAFQETYARGLSKCTVITQGRNVPALRVYQKAGFITSRMQFWYHRWKVSFSGDMTP